jgi:hypothetical protein
MRFYILITVAIAAHTWGMIMAKDFSTKVIDQLGKPVENATGHLYWIRSKANGHAEAVDLGNTLTDMHGKAKGYYRHRRCQRRRICGLR